MSRITRKLLENSSRKMICLSQYMDLSLLWLRFHRHEPDRVQIASHRCWKMISTFSHFGFATYKAKISQWNRTALADVRSHNVDCSHILLWSGGSEGDVWQSSRSSVGGVWTSSRDLEESTVSAALTLRDRIFLIMHEIVVMEKSPAAT